MNYQKLTLAVLLSGLLALCSCASGGTEAITLVLGKSSEGLVFLSCKAVSATELNFQFSQPVTVTSLHFSPALQVESVEGGSTVTVRFTGGPGPGERVVADLLARDENGNTINVLVPFRSRNDRVPPMRINELRTEFSRPRCEFIEFKTFGAGNLGALRLFIASNNRAPLVYEFPSIEVKNNEYIVLHLRTLEDSNRDELGSNLEESGGVSASPTARDLWIPGSTKLLRKTDIVYLLDQDDRVVDAVLLSETADPWWNRDFFAEAAEFLYRAGAWKSRDGNMPGPADAVQSTGSTLTRTINRDETLANNSRTADDWYITVTNGATPGRPNNPRRFN